MVLSFVLVIIASNSLEMQLRICENNKVFIRFREINVARWTVSDRFIISVILEEK